MATDQNFSDRVFSMIEMAGQAALDAPDPEAAIRALVRGCVETLGDQEAYLRPGALLPGERHYQKTVRHSLLKGCPIHHISSLPPASRRSEKRKSTSNLPV